jgi:PAS domain-containing protein
MFRSRTAGLASLANDGINGAAPGLHDSRAMLTLDSIGDAVLSTDLAGRVTYLNAVAERMTGWSAIEAAGRPLQEVMRMFDADTREPVAAGGPARPRSGVGTPSRQPPGRAVHRP